MGIGNCYQDCYDDCHTQEVSDLKINVSDYSEICYQSCNDQNLANNATCGSEVSWILGFGLIIRKNNNQNSDTLFCMKSDYLFNENDKNIGWVKSLSVKSLSVYN